VIRTLDEAGYTVTKATLGVPYRVSQPVNRQRGYPKVFMTSDLRGIDDEDVVLIDFLKMADRSAEDFDTITTAVQSAYVTEWPPDRIVDPRPLLASQTMGKIDRILEYGGVVIAVAGPHVHGTYARFEPQLLEISGSFGGADVYALLGTQAYGMNMPESAGREVGIVNESHPVSIILTRHREAIRYAYKIEPWYRRLEFWTAIATNRYGDMIAGVMRPETGGTVILLPPAGDETAEIIREIIEQALPSLAPDVVPHLAKKEWLNDHAYIPPAIAEQLTALEELDTGYRKQKALIEAALEEERWKTTYLQDLLTATDRDLVMAVHAVLRNDFGFLDVIDVDAERKQPSAAAGAALREDLCVPSTGTVLLFEVKGIGGRGTDSDILQVEKAVTLHADEHPGQAVKGITVVNHQRHRPPLERDYEFLREDLLKILNAKSLAVITTWDLFRLAVNRQTHNWPKTALQDVFTKSGRIGFLPAHYEEIGRVTEYFAKSRAVVIYLTAPLAVGDRIAFERPVVFYEQNVEGIRVHDEPTTAAPAGSEIGILTNIPRADARPGRRVYRVLTAW